MKKVEQVVRLTQEIERPGNDISYYRTKLGALLKTIQNNTVSDHDLSVAMTHVAKMPQLPHLSGLIVQVADLFEKVNEVATARCASLKDEGLKADFNNSHFSSSVVEHIVDYAAASIESLKDKKVTDQLAFICTIGSFYRFIDALGTNVSVQPIEKALTPYRDQQAFRTTLARIKPLARP